MKTYKIMFTGDMPFDEEDEVFTSKDDAIELCKELNIAQKEGCDAPISMEDFLDVFEHFEVITIE